MSVKSTKQTTTDENRIDKVNLLRGFIKSKIVNPITFRPSHIYTTRNRNSEQNRNGKFCGQGFAQERETKERCQEIQGWLPKYQKGVKNSQIL